MEPRDYDELKKYAEHLFAMAQYYKQALEWILEAGIDTSTDSGMQFVRETLSAARPLAVEDRGQQTTKETK